MGYAQVGRRIRERLLSLGYVKADGEPDVQRFCWDHRFGTTHVYAWLADRMTPFKDLIRLCTALECSAEWLLTGEERKKASPARSRPRRARNLLLLLSVAGALAWPSPGGSAQPDAPRADLKVDTVRLIGSRRRMLGMACA